MQEILRLANKNFVTAAGVLAAEPLEFDCKCLGKFVGAVDECHYKVFAGCFSLSYFALSISN